MDGQIFVAQQNHHDYSAHDPGRQCGNGRARHPHVESIDQNSVANDVQSVHSNGDDERDQAVAHGAEQRGTGVIHRKKGIGDCRIEEVSLGIGHNIVGDIPHERAQHIARKTQGKKSEHPAQQRAGMNELLGRRTSIFPISPAQILAGHHRAARGQGGEHIDEQHVDGVHSGDSGHRGFAHAGDHHGVRKANGDR